MPPPHDGNEYLPFPRMIELETLDDNTYRSIALPFSPGGIEAGRNIAYGGHVYAQAAWAACQTVGKGFLISNVSGNFILPGIPTVKFVYRVQRVHDGRSYCTRIVNVTQPTQKEEDAESIVFTCTCVFKTSETSHLSVQSHVNIWEKYAVVLGGKKPLDFEECPGFDQPWYWRALEDGDVKNDEFPGLQMTKVEMKAYNQGRHPLDRRQLIFYRSLGEMPSGVEEGWRNMHLCAHLYASDRNSLFIVANNLDMGDHYSGIGSLVHHVVFHSMEAGDVELEKEGDAWFVKESWTTRYEAGRAMYLSRAWSPEGRHILSVWQDGLIRLPRDEEGKQTVEGTLKSWERLDGEEEVKMVRRRKNKGKL